MPHKRTVFGNLNQQMRETRRQRQAEWKRANDITLDYSFCDRLKVIGEIVFAQSTLQIVTEKLKEEFGGAVPEHAIDHAYGEVLNHFGV